MPKDSSDRSESIRVAILTDWIATMRRELLDERLDHTPDLRDLKLQTLAHFERLLSIDVIEDFDSVADIDAHSNQRVTAETVGTAFAAPAVSAKQRGIASGIGTRKKKEYKIARALYDEAGGAPVSEAKRLELEKRISNECDVERKTAHKWIVEFVRADAAAE